MTSYENPLIVHENRCSIIQKYYKSNKATAGQNCKFALANESYRASLNRHYRLGSLKIANLSCADTLASLNSVASNLNPKKGAVMTKVEINGTKHTVMLDSGADISVISTSFAKKINAIYTPGATIECLSAGNNVLSIVGIALISVKLENYVLKEWFLVSDVLNQEMIIGADLIWGHQIDIMCSDGTARIGDNVIEITARNTGSVCSMVTTTAKPSQLAKIDETNLIPSQRIRLIKLLDDYEDIFSKNEDDIGKSDFIHKITLNSETPVKSRAYRIPYAQKQCVEQEIAKMLRMGVIVKSNSDYCAPIVLVKKKDNSNRFCIDFRKLNATTIKDCYPMPFIDEKLESLSGKFFFFQSRSDGWILAVSS